MQRRKTDDLFSVGLFSASKGWGKMNDLFFVSKQFQGEREVDAFLEYGSSEGWEGSGRMTYFLYQLNSLRGQEKDDLFS